MSSAAALPESSRWKQFAIGYHQPEKFDVVPLSVHRRSGRLWLVVVVVMIWAVGIGIGISVRVR